MDDDNSNPFRRMSSRTRKVAPRMAAALASSDNRTQVCRICFIENRFWVYGFCIWHKLVNVDEIEDLLALFQHHFKVLATCCFRLLLLALKP